MTNHKKMLGARIKELRKAAGLSQQVLSVKADIESSKYLSRIEVGGCYPSVDVLERIAVALGVEMHALFLFEHHDNEAISKREIEGILSRASREQRQLIIKLIKAVCQ